MREKQESEQPRSHTPAQQLSVHRSFVVQLYVPAETGAELWQGRVEHVTSGQRQRFASLEELVAFVEQLTRASPVSLDVE